MYAFSWEEVKLMWDAFNRYADNFNHFLHPSNLVPALQEVFPNLYVVFMVCDWVGYTLVCCCCCGLMGLIYYLVP